jgi:hypothetical protein
MTQKNRVYTMLKLAGENGVTTNDFLRAYIPRFSARIQELRDEGKDIRTRTLRRGQFVYTLHELPEYKEVEVREGASQLAFA